jgi:hypothetical protein
LRRRWLDGDWVAAEGAVFPQFDDEKHVCDPFPIPKAWPCWLSKDPGRDHPDATVVLAIAPTGHLFVVAESCVKGSTTEMDAKTLDHLCAAFTVTRKLGDPHMMFSETKFSESGRTIAQQLAGFGHAFVPAPAARNQAEIAQQVEMIRTALVRVESDGCPTLQVFRGCQNVIRGFQTWSYARNAKGQMTGGDDKFEDVADDEMDCVRMLIAARPTFDGPRFSADVRR